jgi:hypothetical protein
MRSADDIKRLFKNAELGISPDADKRVFEDVLKARWKTKEGSTLTWSRWRMTMKNPITKLAVAAVIAVAGIAGIVMWSHTGSSIALANVLAQVQQSTAYMYQMTWTVSGKAPTGKDINQNMESTVLIAQDYGMKMTMGMSDPNGGKAEAVETYMLPQEKTMITLMPATKQYMRMELDDTLIEKTRQQNYDLTSMLKQILDCKYESLGRSTIDGVEVEGFQTTDPNYLAGMMGQEDVKIWVDVKTQLPVRLEMDMQMGDMQIRAVVHNFQWNYPVTAADFTPTIPADYRPLPGGPVKMPAMNEESAIAGLKMCVELAGRYPEKLDFMAMASLMGKLDKDNPLTRKLAEENEDLSQDEIVKKTMDKFMPIQGAAMFYMSLVQEKKEPAYYGNVVTPQDADKVLMRWKVSDTEYRVIYGDLHAETVSPEKLAELEKDVPK